MDPEDIWRRAEQAKRMVESGMHDYAQQAMESGIYDHYREAMESGVYDDIIQKAAQEIEQVRQPGQIGPVRAALEDLDPMGIARLPAGNTSVGEIALGNITNATTLANADIARIAATDLTAVVEDAKQRWFSNPSGQHALQGALPSLAEDPYEPLRRAMDLAVDPGVRQMVHPGAAEAENQALAEILRHLEREEPAIAETSELTPAERLITAETLYRIMLFILVFDVALSAARAVPGADTHVALLNDIIDTIAKLIALREFILVHRARDK